MTTTANTVRGERVITLGGKKWKIVPTWEALIAIEERLGVNALPLFERIARGNVGVRDLTVIIAELLRGGGAQGIKDKMVGQLILDAGLGDSEILLAVTGCLKDAMEGGTKNDPGAASGEAKAAE